MSGGKPDDGPRGWVPPWLDGGSVPGPSWWIEAASRAMKDALEKRKQLEALSKDPPKADVGQTPAEVIYTENKLRLLHYRPMVARRLTPPVLIAYALVNKPYILDLQPDKSVVRAMLLSGIDVYLIDWGIPSDRDRYLEMNDYINGYIHRCVKQVCRHAGVDRTTILGYCMGGTLSSMYASLHPERVHNLIIICSPISFSGEGGLLGRWSSPEFFDVDLVVDVMGNIPGDFLNGGYLLMDPVGNLYSKYVKFLDMADNRPFVEMFARMERWVNDGIPLAGENFRQFIKWTYQNDLLMKGEIYLGGRRVDLAQIDVPLLNIMGTYDHLVPPEMSRPMTDAVSSDDATTLEFPTGHIGLSVSSNSHKNLWPKVVQWLWDRGWELGDDGTFPVEGSPGEDRFDTCISPEEATGPHSSRQDPLPGIPADLRPDGLEKWKSGISKLTWPSAVAASPRTEGMGRWNSPGHFMGKGMKLPLALTRVNGIGQVTAGRLAEAGVENAQALCDADVDVLSRQTGISRAKLVAWKRAAVRLVGD